jgi:hypothetical protein
MHSSTNSSDEDTRARIAFVLRSYPSVVENLLPMLPPHREPATWVGHTST